MTAGSKFVFEGKSCDQGTRGDRVFRLAITFVQLVNRVAALLELLLASRKPECDAAEAVEESLPR